METGEHVQALLFYSAHLCKCGHEWGSDQYHSAWQLPVIYETVL